ncbi:hypothetical protein QJU83_02310 [Pasteurella skyensis]|uniref:hypothetical protein n=1 Tax=Phocoenobacter skyensis TaxID=97481 RepID=UPI002750C39B|nr:hypothetical protein [Pasteurella skyensis]MDP8176376.1 hypothetical protein [Pasteurella skyensis]MDP8199111.1 hypothetical protein [Pasteurella skyensis]
MNNAKCLKCGQLLKKSIEEIEEDLETEKFWKKKQNDSQKKELSILTQNGEPSFFQVLQAIDRLCVMNQLPVLGEALILALSALDLRLSHLASSDCREYEAWINQLQSRVRSYSEKHDETLRENW